MFGQNQISDKELQKTVSKRLERTGTGSQSKVSAIVRRGAVTISGKLQYERQRAPILKAVSSIAGVRQVIDQLQMPPSTRPRPTSPEYKRAPIEELTELDPAPIDAPDTIAQDPDRVD